MVSPITTFAEKAKKLIDQDKVASSSAAGPLLAVPVLPVFESKKHCFVYPSSTKAKNALNNVFYTGSGFLTNNRAICGLAVGKERQRILLGGSTHALPRTS
jgi:ABC-type branched-subunit amino acid transport system substrate-binding protein